MIKQTGKASSVAGGMALAAIVGMIMTFVFSATIAYALNREWITWEHAGYWIMTMLFIVSFVSGKCAILRIKRQRIIVSVMSGVIYWGILLCVTALFWGGDFSAVGETAGLIGAGCGSAALISMPSRKKYKINLKRKAW